MFASSIELDGSGSGRALYRNSPLVSLRYVAGCSGPADASGRLAEEGLVRCGGSQPDRRQRVRRSHQISDERGRVSCGDSQLGAAQGSKKSPLQTCLEIGVRLLWVVHSRLPDAEELLSSPSHWVGSKRPIIDAPSSATAPVIDFKKSLRRRRLAKVWLAELRTPGLRFVACSALPPSLRLINQACRFAHVQLWHRPSI